MYFFYFVLFTSKNLAITTACAYLAASFIIDPECLIGEVKFMYVQPRSNIQQPCD